HRDDNEERSAHLAQRILPPEMSPDVVRLVIATKHHDPADGDIEAAALCDADLSVLGSDHDRYQQYARDIRNEFARVPQPEFRRARTRMLSTLLDHRPLFTTAPGQTRWEAAARTNVGAEIARLGPLSSV